MYEGFFGLRERPFSIAPDPAFLYRTQKHRRALAMLEYGLLNQVGFSVITGEIGAGKTTLVRKVLQGADDSVNIGLVSNTQCESFEELLSWILFAFELEFRAKSKVELYQTFTEFLVEQFGLGKRVVLIIDEAQNLTPETLEQLRMLSNVNADKNQVLQLILVGQPGLWALLRRPELAQFAQRIGVDYHIDPLDLNETIGYVKHRLSVAGGDGNLFQPDTFELIWHSTRGIPRLINLLCDMALVYAYADQQHSVDRRLISSVIKDKRAGLSPLSAGEGVQDLVRPEKGVQ